MLYLSKSFLIILVISLLAGCITNVWTGASLVYDRHNMYKKFSDFKLAADASRALFKDRVFKRTDCSIDLAVINGDILLAGHVPTNTLRQEALTRITALGESRRIFNQLAIKATKDNTLEDDWITTQLRSQIFADANINPHDFKIVTVEQIVYLMGDVIPSEAALVIHFARSCPGVKRVVKLFKYYNLSDQPREEGGNAIRNSPYVI